MITLLSGNLWYLHVVCLGYPLKMITLLFFRIGVITLVDYTSGRLKRAAACCIVVAR